MGAGVIGAGWVVRFLAFDWDVRVYDPAPDVLARLQQTVERARPHVAALFEGASFDGQLQVVGTLAEATEGVHWIQESLPENLQLKRDVLQSLSAGDALVASSTSGFKPSALVRPPLAQRFAVCHPFNPVYLLPLVEVVPHGQCQRAEAFIETLESIGMAPLRIRKEIDGHVADRLLEAVWREALWLVKDGVATTREIDTAITHGFGLRWAQMGLFETYRLGGGEGGFAAFLEQFGPALAWPWSRLTDVPELDEALIQKIVTQTGESVSIDALSEQRDRNLVALLKALRTQSWAAGAHLERAQRQTGGTQRMLGDDKN